MKSDTESVNMDRHGVSGANGGAVPPYRAEVGRSLVQLTASLSIYVAMVLSGLVSLRQGQLYVAFGIAVVTGLMVVRLFVLQHDCSHYSFFSGKRWNDRAGLLLGLVTLVPHAYWQKMHFRHHATSGNLSSRGLGDIFTHTCEEYKALTRGRRIAYRLYRHPAVFFVAGAFYYFLMKMRFESLGETKAERYGIRLINGALVSAYALAFVSGFDMGHLVVFHAIVIYVSGTVGLTLFYVQHQFEDAYWRQPEDWNRLDAAIAGSSHLLLPGLAERFVCRINLHHVHHFDAKIPNYRLRDAHRDLVRKGLSPPEITLRKIPGLYRLKVIDDKTRKMVPFPETR